MWVGSPSDLKRLLRLVEKQYEPLVSEHVTESTKHARKMIDLAYDASDKAEWEERLQSDENAAKKAANFDLRLTSRDGETRSVTGSATELVDYIDGRRFDEMDISAPTGGIRGHRFTLRGERKRGLYVGVSSSDSKWCLATYSEVAEEVRRQVPPWRFIRQGWFWWLLGSILWVGFTSSIDLYGSSGDGVLSAAELVTSALVGLVGGLFIGMAIYLGSSLIPAFELTPPGARSRGKAALVLLGSVASALTLGVAGNAISKILIG
jgi:hypothetical protein